jgi:hypothetical protein
VCVKENKQAETGPKTPETINKRKCEPNLFTLKEINIWKKLWKQEAEAEGMNEFNRYLLGLQEQRPERN